MRFGGTTVVFTRVTENLDIRGPYNQPILESTDIEVTGCHFRPVKTDETTTELGTKVTQEWRLTCPPDVDVLNAKASDEVRIDDVVYQIVGAPQPRSDLQGRPHHVTITCRKAL